jgi:hypothetical protein
VEKSNNFDVKSNEELFKQALVEGVNRHIDKAIEKEKQIEEMARTICKHYNTEKCTKCGEYPYCSVGLYAEALYNAGYRKQSEGEWISNRQTDELICNLCGAIAPVDCEKERFYKSNFCPNCGSKMTRKEDEGKWKKSQEQF